MLAAHIRGCGVCSLVALAALWCSPAPAALLISNGGFEVGVVAPTPSGIPAPWTVALQPGSSGDYFAAGVGDLTPLSGSATVGPASGSYYAVSDQNFFTAGALLQTFTVPTTAALVTLSFDMFVNDLSGSGGIVDASGLDFTSGGIFAPNQHARVDILTAGASPLSTAPADIVGNFYLGVDAGLLPNAYTPYAFDITALVGAGGTFQLRFAHVVNLAPINMGVDNVSIDFTPASGNPTVPEPASLALFAGLALSGAVVSRVRRARAAR